MLNNDDMTKEIAALWSRKFGTTPETIHRPGIQLIFRGAPHRPNRIILYHHADTTLVTLPEHLQGDDFAPALDRLKLRQAAPISAAAVIKALPMLPLSFHWRDFIYYQLPDQIAAPRRDDVRLLNADDAGALEKLMEACTEFERALARISLSDPIVSGCILDGQLAAVASLLFADENPSVADVGVLTHPAFRGRGLAASLIPPLADYCRERDLTMQYVTQEENIGSIRTAEKSGFRLWFVEEGLAITAE